MNSSFNATQKAAVGFWKGANEQKGGDPAKLAQGLLKVIDQSNPPKRFLAGVDAVGTAEQVVKTLIEQINEYRELSSPLLSERLNCKKRKYAS
jgi:hypothetical protein